MTAQITGSMLYDLVHCPYRVHMDLFGDQSKRDPVSPFVELLWEKGYQFEYDVMRDLDMPFTDLSRKPKDTREKLTAEAMAAGDDVIYGGRITSGDLLGEPDLMRRADDGYIAGDIKSGSGLEGVSENEDGRPKKHYGVQLALYTDILERKGLAAGRTAFVWDIHGDEIVYNMDTPLSSSSDRTLWEFYETCLKDASAITSRKIETLPALQSRCKLCHWRSLCHNMLVRMDDLTLIPGMGRSKRDALAEYFRRVGDLAGADLDRCFGKPGSLPRGIGMGTIRRFQERAKLQKKPDARPYLRKQILLPPADVELFFDVETDPMRDVCYLHGFAERRNGRERYVSFFADKPDPEDEEAAFKEAWEFMRSSAPCALYYYSHYERTTMKKLAAKYPGVATEDEVVDFFESDGVVDLFGEVVRPNTEWPTHDLSIKTLATYLGFRWRDAEPSGAASIEWYHTWVKTGDDRHKKRILEYNHDDCVATRVLLDAIRTFEVMPVLD
jgi:predicted RecB family nuclease